MAAILTTTDTEDMSDEFSPVGEFNVQCDATNPMVVVEIFVKLDADGTYSNIDSFRPANTPVQRFVQFPFVKLGIRGNKSGDTVNVWAV